jgi:hypothetical protein
VKAGALLRRSGVWPRNRNVFFKWVKQHLRIKHFYGNSDNAAKTQIWIAVCVYVLVAIVKKSIKSDLSLHTILQILSVNAFALVPLVPVLTELPSQFQEADLCNQWIFLNKYPDSSE